MLNTIQDRHSGKLRRGTAQAARALPLLGLPLVLLLSGCASQQSMSIFDPASGYNREMNRMLLWAIVLSVIIFVGVSAALFYTVQKFREDRHDAPPAQFHGNNRLETVLVGVPILIVVLLSFLTVKSMAVLNPVPAQATKIDVLGKQFWWNFAYPTAPAGTGVVTNGNEMIMPTNEHVALTVTSGDVIHGFWAPNIGGQRAAIPSVKKTWTVNTDRAGVYQGNCSQLCGGSHANMRYKVIALDQARYEATLKAMQDYKAPEPAPGSAEARGYALFMNGNTATGALACSACHRVQGTTANGAAGPDLSFFGTRRTLGAGVWEAMGAQQWEEPKAAKQLHDWIKHSPVVKPGSIMPRYDGGEYLSNGKLTKGGTLTDAEIDDIAAYLRSLKLPEAGDYWKDTPVHGAQTTAQATTGGTQ